MYSITKATFNKALVLIAFIFKKRENLFNLNKDHWKSFLKTRAYIKQKCMIYTFLKKFEKFYKGVEKFHQKMKNQLKEKSDPKILDLIDNKKEGALRVM